MYKKYIKRLLDILLCLLALPFFMIIFIIIAPIIYFTDKGPIFFNGERLGYKGRIFKMYKFRSMYVNAPDIRNDDGSTYNSSNDIRVTKIGKIIRKTSIDEIPQILNIIKGDMSIIGPRPGLPDKEWYLSNDNEKERRKIRPGITGYSQAYFRNSDTMEKRMQNDIYYANNVTFILDCKIFFKTISSVICSKNIYRN